MFRLFKPEIKAAPPPKITISTYVKIKHAMLCGDRKALDMLFGFVLYGYEDKTCKITPSRSNWSTLCEEIANNKCNPFWQRIACNYGLWLTHSTLLPKDLPFTIKMDHKKGCEYLELTLEGPENDFTKVADHVLNQFKVNQPLRKITC